MKTEFTLNTYGEDFGQALEEIQALHRVAYPHQEACRALEDIPWVEVGNQGA